MKFEEKPSSDGHHQLEALLLQLLAAVRQGKEVSCLSKIPPLDCGALTLVDLCNQFLIAKARAGRGDGYLRELVKQLRSFAKGRESRFAATISAAEIESWLHGQDWSARTIKNHLFTVRTLLSWAVARGDLIHNPALGVDVPTQSNEPPAIHSPAEVKKILEAVRGHDLNTMRCLAIRYFAGLRTSEAVALEEKEIGEKYIEVTAAKAKTRRRRLVTIQPNLRAWLELGGVLPLRQVANRLSEIGRVAGVRWPKNAARHSFVSYHLAKFQNAGKTALEAGHTEQVLFANYREIVTIEQAEDFWAILPNPTR